jgi:hypothetical protein
MESISRISAAYSQQGGWLSRIGELQPGGFVYHLGDALGSVRRTYRYDAQGHRLAIRDGNQYETTFGHDGSALTFLYPKAYNDKGAGQCRLRASKRKDAAYALGRCASSLP